MTSDQNILCVNQYWIHKAKFFDAGSNLRNLLFTVFSCVVDVRNQLLNWNHIDLLLFQKNLLVISKVYALKNYIDFDFIIGNKAHSRNQQLGGTYVSSR
jgi:hypothetical protein